jgi:hypothetical protein
MILRALFWIAVVSFFMPHEPNLGYGHPGREAGIAGLIQSAQSTDVQECSTGTGLCAVGVTALSAFQGVAVNSLDQVKADIDASRHKRFALLAPRD